MLKLKPIENSKLYQRRTISKENLLSSDDVIVSTTSTLQPHQSIFYKNESLIKLNANQAQSLTQIKRNKKMESSVQGKNVQVLGFVCFFLYNKNLLLITKKNLLIKKNLINYVITEYRAICRSGI